MMVRAVRRNHSPSPRPSPPGEGGIELPALDPDRNDEVLARLRDDDPALTVFLSYCQTHIENNLRQAFNVSLSVEQQLDFKNRAGAVAALVEDLEGSRQRLKQELLEKQKAEIKQTPHP